MSNTIYLLMRLAVHAEHDKLAVCDTLAKACGVLETTPEDWTEIDNRPEHREYRLQPGDYFIAKDTGWYVIRPIPVDRPLGIAWIGQPPTP